MGSNGRFLPRTAQEEGPGATGLSLALGHVGHNAPGPPESFLMGFWLTNMGRVFPTRA